MEKTEILHTGQKLIQDEELFKFGIDAVLLSDFASDIIRQNDKVLDIGCGNGIIPVLLGKTSRAQKITGLELQKESAELADKNAKINSLENKIKILNADLRDFKKIFPPCTFNDVVSNPPYMKAQSGKTSDNEHIRIARSEVKCNLEQVIACAEWNIKSNGNFMIIHRPSRIAEICVLMQKYNFGIKTIRFICPTAEEKPTMVLIHAKKDFFPETIVEKNLVISDKDGKYTGEVKTIYCTSCDGPNLPYKK